jgi:hypothetical protein
MISHHNLYLREFDSARRFMKGSEIEDCKYVTQGIAKTVVCGLEILNHVLTFSLEIYSEVESCFCSDRPDVKIYNDALSLSN